MVFSATLSLPLPVSENLRRPKDAQAADSVRGLDARRMRESEFPLRSSGVPESYRMIVTGVQQSFRFPSFRNHCRAGIVQYVTRIRLGTGRGFRYAYSEKLAVAYRGPGAFRRRAATREVVFVEVRSTPR